MNTARFTAGEPAVRVVRVEPRLWHALDDGRLAGRGEATTRPDGRIFLGVDAWHRSVFDQLAREMLAELPEPLHTVVDGTDHELLACWRDAGLTIRRREWEYVLSAAAGATDRAVPPGVTDRAVPPGVTIVPNGAAEPAPLRELADVLRAEVAASVGTSELPVEVPPRPALDADPSNCAVAAQDGDYVGLIRAVQVIRRPRIARIGLLAVRADRQRRGIARALLDHALHALHRAGAEQVSAEVSEANVAAIALFESVGARRAGSTLELVRHGR